MTVKELGGALQIALNELRLAEASGKPSRKERERLRNILFDNVETVIQMSDSSMLEEKVAELEEKIEDLTAENKVLEQTLVKETQTVKDLKKQLKESKE